MTLAAPGNKRRRPDPQSSTLPIVCLYLQIGEQMRFVYHALALSDEDHETRQEFIQRFEAKCRSSLHYLTSSSYCS